jgi:hypothetical protein
VAVVPNGDVYFTEAYNASSGVPDLIRKISGGVVTTVHNGTTDLFLPAKMVVDGDGNLIIADTWDHQIKKFDTISGVLSLIAGTTRGYADGLPLSAQFNYPGSLAIDSLGNIIVADTSNAVIRQIELAATPVATKPDTAISAGPVDGSVVSSTSASFKFAATPATGASLECAVDGATFTARVSPVTLSALAEGSHTFSVRAVNSAGADPTPSTRSWSVNTTVAPVFTDSTPPTSGVVGSAFAGYVFVASGTPAPTFAVGTGSLPAGLTLTSAGVLGGTPTAAGTSAFTVTASNSAGSVSTSSISITISVPTTDEPDLAIRMKGELKDNSLLAYEIRVTNLSPSIASGPVSVVDTLPEGVTFVRSRGAGWSCTSPGRTVTCTLASGIAAGSSASLRIDASANSLVNVTVTNVASLTAADANLSNNVSTVSTRIPRRHSNR